MKTPLTIEELKNRVGKPVFLAKYNEISNRVDLRWVIFKSLNQEILEFTEGVEDLKIGDYICFFDTEVSEEELKQYIETELKEVLDAEEKTKKKTGYERVGKGESYYTINIFKEVVSFTDDEFSEIYTETSYFNDEKLTKNIARAEKLKYQLSRFAALNGGIPSPSDWEDTKSKKYYILYDYEDNGLDVCDRQSLKDFGQIYFKNEEACEKAIEIFKDELIWYFTEFQEMLY